MYWTLMLSSGIVGAIIMKLIEKLLLAKKQDEVMERTSQLLLAAHINELNSTLAELTAIRQHSEFSDRHLVKVLDHMIDILGAQVRANEQLVRLLLRVDNVNEQTELQTKHKASDSLDSIDTLYNDSRFTEANELKIDTRRILDTIREHGEHPPPLVEEDDEDPFLGTPESFTQHSTDLQQETAVIDEPHSIATIPERRSTLQKFSGTQLFAPYRRDRLPKDAELRPMACNELGESGISFFHEFHPDYDMVVVRLAPKDKDVVDLTARVTRVEYAADNQYLICCTFIGRVYL